MFFLSPYSFFFYFFLARFIAVVSIVSVCLVCEFSILTTFPLMPAARFAFCVASFVLFLFCLVILSRIKGEG